MPLVVDPDGVELATIRDLVDLPGLRVLDVGCGDGRLSFACAREGADVLIAYLTPELFDTLVHEFGWSLAQWADFQARGVAAQLL